MPYPSTESPLHDDPVSIQFPDKIQRLRRQTGKQFTFDSNKQDQPTATSLLVFLTAKPKTNSPPFGGSIVQW